MTDRLKAALIQAIEGAGFLVPGPTDHRAAEDGEPVWICNARAALAEQEAPTRAELLRFIDMVASGNTETDRLEQLARELLTGATPPTRARVLVTVSGGVADVETFGPVDYELTDFDNLEAEGLDNDARNERYRQDQHWLLTGEVLPRGDDEADTN